MQPPGAWQIDRALLLGALRVGGRAREGGGAPTL